MFSFRHSNEWPRLHVGVLGKTGVGKSTLINAFFGLPHNDDYAANIDVVECTKTITPYYLPGNEVVLWDVPGFGTQSFKDDADYIETIQLKNYDFYLLLSCNKTDEFEIQLHNEIARQGKRYYYIRTKFFQELRNEKLAHGATFSEMNTRSNIEKQIAGIFPDVPIYFVDSLKPDLYDFPTLMTIIKDGAEFSISSHRDAKQKGLTLVEVRSSAHPRARSKMSHLCVIQ